MADILMAAAIVGFFAVGYLALDGLGKYMDAVYRKLMEQQNPDRKVFLNEIEGKNTGTISKLSKALSIWKKPTAR